MGREEDSEAVSAIVPGARPKIGLTEILNIIRYAKEDQRACLVGLRGYYRDTMGKPKENDRGIYDDAIVYHAPDRLFTFNANCDPSAYRAGIAKLKAGAWKYKIGIHGLSKPKNRRYKALVQAEPVVVIRDGIGEQPPAFLGINLHRGGYRNTSSLGCQTIYPSQWDDFISMVEDGMKRWNQDVITYVLVDLA